VRLPLFPLHTVLAPGIVLPLHVFEERYRVMVRRCIDSSSPFGVVLIREGSEVAPPDGQAAELAIAGVGTFAEIREASRYADGRWDLVVVGTGRFSVREVEPDVEPYLVAEVDPQLDDIGDPDAAAELVERVGRRFVEYLALLQPREGEVGAAVDVRIEVDADSDGEDEDEDDDDEDDEDDDGDEDDDDEADDDGTIESLHIPDDPSALSFLLTGIVQAEPDRKQALLEAATAEERLRDLDELLERELELLRRRLGLYVPDRRGLADRRN
jgi:Lon protease-like protein